MNDNRKFIIIGTSFMIVFFGFLIVASPEALPTQPGYWLSFVIGLVLGVFVCLYLRAVWDPKTLQLKDPNARTADPRWMGLTVLLGLITARVLTYIFAPEIQIMLVNLIFAWFATSFGYMAFQAWWHRPK